MVRWRLIWALLTAVGTSVCQEQVTTSLSICDVQEIKFGGDFTVVVKKGRQLSTNFPVTLRAPFTSESISSYEQCVVKVNKNDNSIIHVGVTHFDLGGRDPCSVNQEHLSIAFPKNSSDEQYGGRGLVDTIYWCGESYSPRLETRNVIVISYMAGLLVDRRSGFTLTVSTENKFQCGRNIDWLVGRQPMFVYSPGYPLPYDNQLNRLDHRFPCTWTFKGWQGNKLQIDTQRFAVEPDTSCRYDFLSIDDVHYCGDQRLQLNSRLNSLTMTFSTDQSEQHDGFVLKIMTVPEEVTCNGDVLLHSSPLSLPLPKLSSGDQMNGNCWWRLDAGSDDRVVLLENTHFFVSLSCSQFELRIYDGKNVSTPRILSRCAPMEMFRSIRSSSRYLYIDIDFHIAGSFGTRLDVVYTASSQMKDSVPPVLYAGSAKSFVWLDVTAWNDRGLVIRGNDESTGNYSTCVKLSLRQSLSNTSILNVNDYFYAFSGWNETFAELGNACGRSLGEIISRSSKILLLRNSVQSLKNVWLVYQLEARYCEPAPVNLYPSTSYLQTVHTDRILFRSLERSLPSDLYTFLPDSGDYPNNAYCRWLIHSADSSHFVQVTVTKSDLYTGCHDNFTAFDYNFFTKEQSNLLHWCGEEKPVIISSEGNGLQLQFITDHSGQQQGVQFQYSSVELANQCPSMAAITAKVDEQFLSSPNYPHNYPNNMDCKWRIQAQIGAVHLSVLALDIVQESLSGCSRGDFLVIYDGPGSDSRILADLCGDTPLKAYVSSGVFMMLHFHSNQATTSTGFRLQYKTTEDIVDTACNLNVYVVTNEDRQITSPYFPNPFPNNLDCFWHVQAPLTQVVMLEIIELDLSCYNPVILYDGPSDNSHRLVTLCGNNYDKQYVSSQKSMYVRFRATNNVNHKGFKFRLRSWKNDQACHGETAHLIAYTATRYLYSPGYPNAYPSNADCSWRIESAHRNMSVLLKIVSARIQSSSYCERDSLSIHDGYGSGSRLLGQYCGDYLETYLSSETYLFLQFRSDSYLEYKGFNLSYTVTSRGASTPSTPESDSSTSSSVGALVGGVMGGVIFFLVAITIVLCFVRRCRQSGSPSTPRPQRRSSSNTVFMMNPVIVNQVSAPPPPYPGLANSSFIHDDLPPSYPAALSSPPPPQSSIHLDPPPPYSETLIDSHPPVTDSSVSEVDGSSSEHQRRGYEYLDLPSASEYSRAGHVNNHEHSTSPEYSRPGQVSDHDYLALSDSQESGNNNESSGGRQENRDFQEFSGRTWDNNDAVQSPSGSRQPLGRNQENDDYHSSGRPQDNYHSSSGRRQDNYESSGRRQDIYHSSSGRRQDNYESSGRRQDNYQPSGRQQDNSGSRHDNDQPSGKHPDNSGRHQNHYQSSGRRQDNYESSGRHQDNHHPSRRPHDNYQSSGRPQDNSGRPQDNYQSSGRRQESERRLPSYLASIQPRSRPPAPQQQQQPPAPQVRQPPPTVSSSANSGQPVPPTSSSRASGPHPSAPPESQLSPSTSSEREPHSTSFSQTRPQFSSSANPRLQQVSLSENPQRQPQRSMPSSSTTRQLPSQISSVANPQRQGLSTQSQHPSKSQISSSANPQRQGLLPQSRPPQPPPQSPSADNLGQPHLQLPSQQHSQLSLSDNPQQQPPPWTPAVSQPAHLSSRQSESVVANRGERVTVDRAPRNTHGGTGASRDPQGETGVSRDTQGDTRVSRDPQGDTGVSRDTQGDTGVSPRDTQGPETRRPMVGSQQPTRPLGFQGERREDESSGNGRQAYNHQDSTDGMMATTV